MLSQYLAKQAIRENLIAKSPNANLGLIVVIPVHDENSLLPTLNSLANCEAPKKRVEVLLIFNAAEDAKEEVVNRNQNAKQEALNWAAEQELIPFELHSIEENSLPKKQAGVGLARKIGMDEAIRRFKAVENENGVLVCFDADSQCESNYLIEIENHFLDQSIAACSIHFEHPTEGTTFSASVYEGIYWYEMHLRYYKNGLRYANLPFAYHTIGSSMAVRASDYCKQGGMNRRKAGEDFYFLQKFIDSGNFSELKSTTVIPSPRQSHRVPFGTGRAIQEMLDGEREIEKSYAFESFEIIKASFEAVEDWYESDTAVNPYLLEFVGENAWQLKLQEIRSQSTNQQRFVKRFFQWFNAFQTLKFIHFLRDKHLELEPMKSSVPKLIAALELDEKENLLETLRKADRS